MRYHVIKSLWVACEKRNRSDESLTDRAGSLPDRAIVGICDDVSLVIEAVSRAGDIGSPRCALSNPNPGRSFPRLVR